MNQRIIVNIKHARYVLLITGAILLASCTKDFKQYNTNPNNVTDEMLEADNLRLGAFFVKMQQNVFPYGGAGSSSTNAYQIVENLAGDIYGGYHGMTHNWRASGDGTTYNFSLGWNGAAFNLFYTGVMGNWSIIKSYTEKSSPDRFAVAQIIKIYAAQRTVDMYGPIPYSKAGIGLGAEYDPVDSVYYSMLRELDAAITALKPHAAAGVTPLKLFDDIYLGNYAQWVRLANSLKLRLAMRMVYADPQKAKQYAESAVNDDYGVITSNADNAIVRGASTTRPYGNPLSGLTNDYNEARMSANMESFLSGYNDPRLAVYFFPSTRKEDPAGVVNYRGIRSGITISDQAPYNEFSKLQTNFKIIWFTAAETWFLRAEGALQGWNMGGTAKELYETGVRTSFGQWGAGDAGGYLQNATSLPKEYRDPVRSSSNVLAGPNLSTITVKWDEAASREVKLERIVTQKWIAVYPNGQEAWSEFRRTRYPKIFSVVTNNSGGTVNTAIQVRRLPYPEEEYRTNGPNVAKGVALLKGPDNGGSKLWWDAKP